MDLVPPPPYDAKKRNTAIDIEAQLPPSMTPPSPTHPKHALDTVCICCPLHPSCSQLPVPKSTRISTPLRRATSSTSTTPKAASNNGNDAASAFFWLFLIFLGLGIWLTITGRIGYVKWRLGVGITFVVSAVVCLIGCISSFDVEAAERKMEEEKRRGGRV